MKIKYPTVNDIINANKKAIELLRVTKAEKHELLVNKQIIQQMLDEVIKTRGSVKKKAAMLLKEINRRHFFGSANKRISFIVAADFLFTNEGKIPLKRIEDVKFLIEIREGRRTLKEIERWLSE